MTARWSLKLKKGQELFLLVFEMHSTLLDQNYLLIAVLSSNTNIRQDCTLVLEAKKRPEILLSSSTRPCLLGTQFKVAKVNGQYFKKQQQ